MLEPFSAAKENKRNLNTGRASVGGSTGVRMPAASSGSTDISNVGSGAWFCGYCGRGFDTKIGLGVHKSHVHREELNSERLSQQPVQRVRVSNDERQRATISSKRLWTESEIKALVKLDLELHTANPGMSEAARNRELTVKFPGRSADSIKGQRKGSLFRNAMSDALNNASNSTPNHTLQDAAASSVASVNTLSPQTDPVSGGDEVESNDGIEANSQVNIDINNNTSVMDEANVSNSVDPEALSSLPDNDQADEANGESISGATQISQSGGTGLNHVDRQLLARLREDAWLYASHIRVEVKRSFCVEQLFNILNMDRGHPNVSSLLERWLGTVIDMDDGHNDENGSRRPRNQPPIRAGYGNGRELRGRQRLTEKVHLQRLYEKRGLRGLAQHVLRDVDSDEFSGANSTPTPEAMTKFWTEVFGTNIVNNAQNVSTTSVEDSPTNDLWKAIVQDDIKGAELAWGKAMGPDGVSVSAWRAVPRSVRALFYNVMLYHGVVLKGLSKARTIFIPKVKNPSNPGEYRPISITSVIQRQLHRIFVAKLNRVHKFDDRQMAFRMGVDGVSNNLNILRTIVGYRKWNTNDLHVVSLDLKKAFDSVSHDAIFEAMSNLECPTLFVDYLKQLYSSAKTCLELGNGVSTNIRIGRGVFQGDPLSPIIFNHIIDKALKKLDDDYGYICNDTPITCMAFADDINVIGNGVAGTQLNINSLVNELAKANLEVNPSKCLSLSIMTNGHTKATVIDTTGKFSINGEKVTPITPSTKWKYLGINLTGEKIDKQLPDMQPKLNRVKNALLKPQQKLELIGKVVLPSLFHQAVLGGSTREELSEIDVQVRHVVREIMHFPHDIPISYMHAPVRCGGLGMPELAVKIPLLRHKRLRRFTEFATTVAPRFKELVYYRQTQHEVDNFLRKNELSIDDHDLMAKYYLSCLDRNCATRGLSEAYHSAHSRAWSGMWSNEISGGDFIKYHLISSCSLPTLARRAWGRLGINVLCREGCNCTESLNHVLQECKRSHGGRVLRHDRALGLIHNAVVRKFGGKFSVEKEPQLQTQQGLRKPDLILHGGNDAIVIDLHIVGMQNMKEARQNKVAKYRDIPGFTKLVQNKYKVGKVSYESITVSYCGIIEKSSRELLRELNFSGRDIFRITTSILRGSWLSWFQFKRTHQQRFYDILRT